MLTLFFSLTNYGIPWKLTLKSLPQPKKKQTKQKTKQNKKHNKTEQNKKQQLQK